MVKSLLQLHHTDKSTPDTDNNNLTLLQSALDTVMFKHQSALDMANNNHTQLQLAQVMDNK